MTDLSKYDREELETMVQSCGDTFKESLRLKEVLNQYEEFEVPQLHTEIEKYKKDIENLKKELQGTHKKSEDKDETCAQYKNKIASLEDALTKSDMNVLQAKELAEQLQEKNKKLDITLANTRRGIEHVSKNYEIVIKDLIDNYDKKIEVLNQTTNNLNASLSSNMTDKEATNILEAQITQVTNENRSLTAENSELLELKIKMESMITLKDDEIRMKTERLKECDEIFFKKPTNYEKLGQTFGSWFSGMGKKGGRRAPTRKRSGRRVHRTRKYRRR